MALILSARASALAPSVTLSLDARAKELRACGLDIISFGSGEPDFATPEYIREAAKAAVDQGMTHYTPVAGTLELRKEICKKLERDNGLSYAPTQVLVSDGAKHALFNALTALINPGDEVLLPSPCWVSYPEMVRMTGGVPVSVPGREEDDFLVSADGLRTFVTERTKALILNSPGNPAGGVYSRERLAEIGRLAVERGFYVISDEIYEKLVYDGAEHVSIASLSDDIQAQTIVVNSLSKTYAMTGWRVGYAAGPQNVIRAMTAFQSHTASNANSIAQYAAQAALCGDGTWIRDMVAEFDARRKLMYARIGEIPGLSARLPRGAFYMLLNISALIGRSHDGQVITGSESFADLLLDSKRVAVIPAKAFGTDAHVRLSYAASRQSIEIGMDRIADFVAELR